MDISLFILLISIFLIQWLPQHDSVSCEQFLKWYEDNKTENVTDFISKLLNENGIGWH